MVRIKICGLTNLADAWLSAEAGAHYLGFVFYPPSPRSMAAATVREIVRQLRRRPECPTLVGVFVDERPERVAALLEQCELDLAQLSGRETPNQVGDPASPLFGRCYKALRPTSYAEAEADAEWYLPPDPAPDKEPSRPALLLDAYHPTLPGGTGRTGDWNLAARLAGRVPGLMLAGGLNPDNVAGAIAWVRPFAVDVASGVEARPGRKDPAQLQAFVAAVASASTGQR